MKKITFLLICLLTITMASAQLTSVALVGSGTEQGWPADPQEDADKMTSNDSENWTITDIKLLDGAIKFRGNDSWDLPYNWGGTDFPSGTATVDGPGINVTGGIYNVSFNSTSRVYSFQFVSHINISIIGDATPGGWETDTDMSTTDGINYNLEGITLIAGNLKFRGNHSWTLPYNWGATDFPSGVAVKDTDGIVVPSDGKYNITFNINTAAYSFDSTLDTDNLDITSFSVYPNPSKFSWNIKSEQTMKSVKVFNVLGKQVLSLKTESNLISIDNNSLGKGVYFAQIKSDLGVSSLKLIKE